MAATAVLSPILTSFVYEDLVSKTQAIQRQMIEMENALNDRCKNDKKAPDELQSRSLTFIDPYGNRTINQYMDHESINKVIKKYKKDYIPKYLQQWIKIGTIKQNVISSLSGNELKLPVSHYTNGCEFIAYGMVTVWAEFNEYSPFRKLALPVLLTDNMDKITKQIKKDIDYSMELKLCTIDQNTKSTEKDWNESKMLKLEDTVISCQLYQDNCIIMAKIIEEKVNCDFSLSFQSE
jgi:hypothetical protein